uniref:Zeta_toxin domain-containing protein n=1 Tax=Anisakis simplex TaxID=6269 RepID=A0A0M3JFY6_ANISI
LAPIVNSNLTKQQQEDEMLKIAKEHGGEIEAIFIDNLQKLSCLIVRQHISATRWQKVTSLSV